MSAGFGIVIVSGDRDRDSDIGGDIRYNVIDERLRWMLSIRGRLTEARFQS